MQDRITQRADGGMTFAGPNAVEVYRATAVASGLRLYARTGMKPNRAYTPKAMMDVAQRITGQRFKARAYGEAADALTTWAQATAAAINAAEKEG